MEPWACVEDSYVNPERQTIKPGGRLLIVGEDRRPVPEKVGLSFAPAGRPAEILAISAAEAPAQPQEGFDDIIYLGASRKTIEVLNDKLASRGIMNIVLGGKKIGEKVSVGIGRVHYGMTRWIGTTGSDPMASYRNIPATGEIRAADTVVVVGAGGPMGQMHVIRSICSGAKNLTVIGTDVDDGRLEALRKKAEPWPGPMASRCDWSIRRSSL